MPFSSQTRSIATQRVAPFTGEGAYHGSTKARPQASKPPAPSPMVEEMRPTTLEALSEAELARATIEDFDAVFPNRWQTLTTLPVPSQDAIRDDGVTFCWCPIDAAIAEAGPLTRSVLEAMRARLDGRKRHVYIDSKIQYFEAGDVPVDSQHWHVDGSITARGPKVERLGFGVVHDMAARLREPAKAPTYLSYQSSTHCATRFVSEPVTLRLPALIANFDDLDRMVRALDPAWDPQPAAAIVGFDGLCLHRATAASDAGWRLWVRCVETDREVHVDARILECYGTVFRTPRDRS